MTVLSPIQSVAAVAPTSAPAPTTPAADSSSHTLSRHAARTRGPGLSAHLRARIARDFHARLHDEWGGRFVTHGRTPGSDAVRLDGNDYLAVTGHPRIVQAQIDSLAHMSLWEGVRASGATAHPFRHNDPGHLARMIARHGPGLVVVDSVYSTTGALCPLVDVVDIAQAHDCMILVDESHSLGTHGPQGRGLCAQLGLTDRVHFITASLAKAFAGRAGFFTMPDELRYYLMCHSYPSIFSSSLLPHEVAGLAATLEVLRASDAARERLRQHTVRVRARLAQLGYPIAQGSEQIIALEAGTEVDTLALREALESRGIFGAIFVAPATARNRAMVRLTLHAALTDAELGHLEQVAAEIAPQVRPWAWPSARRQRPLSTSSA